MTQPFKAQSDNRLVTDAKQDASSNNLAKIASKKFTDIKLRGGIKPIRQMDSSDLRKPDNSQAIKKLMELKQQETKALALASSSSLPPHLLMASLLEQLCYMYVKERTKANQLFKILCERLSRLNVIAPLSHLDEMSSLRFQHRAMLDKIVRTAMKSLDRQSLLALPPIDQSLNIDSLSIKDEDIISEHTSRYNIEFQEVSLLGKGGFGYVFKARNYLDGCEYAVKKIKFKHKNTDKLLKLLREVKALANLHHTNIVGYNAAWLEYDNPYGSRKESRSHQCAHEEDSSNGGTQSKLLDRQDQSTSLSVEFYSSNDENHLPQYPNLAGNGLAMNAKYFSQVKVREVFGSKENVLPNGGRGDASKQPINSSRLTPGSPRQQTDRCKQQADRCKQQADICKHVVIEEEISSSFNFNYSDNNCESQTQEKLMLKYGKHFQIDLDISHDHKLDNLAINTEGFGQHKNPQSVYPHGHSSVSPATKLKRVPVSLTTNSSLKETDNYSVRGSRTCSPLREPQEAVHASGSRTCSPLREPQEAVHVSGSRTCSPLREPQEAVHVSGSRTCSPLRSPFRHSQFFHNTHISDDEDIDPFPDDACQDDKLSFPESFRPSSTLPSSSVIYSKVSLSVEEELSYAGLPPPRTTRPSRSMEHPAPRMSHVSEKDGVCFVAMDTSASPSRRGSQKDELPSYKRSISSGAANNTDEVMESRNHNYDFQNSITLYIQMELCSKTLQDWLYERNLEQGDNMDTTSFRLDNMRIFHQLLLGVSFIHSHGLIHRDLKPRNIFLSGNDLHVKIGDFGLAKENMLSQGREEIVLKPSPTDEVSAFPYDNHTTGVGTSSYASPEQLQGSFYDVKSDMYSLGVILFEMFNVFHTEMERLKEIEKLRKKNHCPKAFKQKWPLQADSIKALVSSVPSERPSAKDLLNSRLFLSQEQQIKWLQQTVVHQEKEIEELKNTNQEKDRLITKLQKSLKEAQFL